MRRSQRTRGGGAPSTGRSGEAVRYGDLVGLEAVATGDGWVPVAIDPLGILCADHPHAQQPAAAPATAELCRRFGVEGFVDLCGVPLTYGCRLYLRASAALCRGHGCHLHADPEVPDEERVVRAEFCDRGAYQEVCDGPLPSARESCLPLEASCVRRRWSCCGCREARRRCMSGSRRARALRDGSSMASFGRSSVSIAVDATIG